MDDKLLQIFAEESWEIIESLEEGLVSLEQDADPEKINAIFRAAHTMKGNAGIVGFNDVLDLTHLMEGLLDDMRQGKAQPDADTVGVLLSAVDALKSMIEGRLSGGAETNPAEVMNALRSLTEHTPSPSAAQATPKAEGKAADRGDNQEESLNYKIRMRFEPDLFNTGTDPLQLMLELSEFGTISNVACHADGLPQFDEMDPNLLYLWWEFEITTSEHPSTIDNVFIFVQDDNDISIEQMKAPEPTRQSAPKPRKPEAPKAQKAPEKPKPEVPKAQPPSPPEAPEQPQAPAQPKVTKPPVPTQVMQAAPTIRVDTEKLDKLVNLVGELVIGVARVAQIAGEDTLPEMNAAVEALEHISRDLQEQVMRVRMVPVEGTFNRFQRVVRDLAGELGKKIRLEMTGTETELDKNVIEQIADPLKHLVRNSADHGLETPQDRLASGKPETGTIVLKAYQQEGKIIIEVADDGKGINRDAVLNKAIERGLTSGGSQLGDSEVFGFMFQPGFSTAAQVTEVSGRGVGLDVVKKNIESLRGSVEVHSVQGEGTTFRIKLPLTLAIIDGMMVRVGEEVLTLPVLSIVESIRPRPEDVKTVEGQGELVSVRDEYLPLVRLYNVLHLPTERTDPTTALVVIIESVSRRFGILVDDILGEQQAVIKSLEQNYRKINGVAGATILGDGRVSLILDIHGLEKLAFA